MYSVESYLYGKLLLRENLILRDDFGTHHKNNGITKGQGIKVLFTFDT